MIENNIFKNYKIDLKKLKSYGFNKENDYFIYKRLFMNNDFEAIIIVKNDKVVGHIIDKDTNFEYTQIRLQKYGKFTEEIISNYQNILIDIRNKCFVKQDFINDQTNRISLFIKNKYSCNPEFLWEKSPYTCVFRNKDNKKWFGIIMNIKGSNIGLDMKEIEIINLKLGKEEIECLLNKKGFYKAYHMNKKSWITVILNDTLKDNEICELIIKSYNNIIS